MIEDALARHKSTVARYEAQSRTADAAASGRAPGVDAAADEIAADGERRRGLVAQQRAALAGAVESLKASASGAFEWASDPDSWKEIGGSALAAGSSWATGPGMQMGADAVRRRAGQRLSTTYEAASTWLRFAHAGRDLVLRVALRYLGLKLSSSLDSVRHELERAHATLREAAAATESAERALRPFSAARRDFDPAPFEAASRELKEARRLLTLAYVSMFEGRAADPSFFDGAHAAVVRAQDAIASDAAAQAWASAVDAWGRANVAWEGLKAMYADGAESLAASYAEALGWAFYIRRIPATLRRLDRSAAVLGLEEEVRRLIARSGEREQSMARFASGKHNEAEAEAKRASESAALVPLEQRVAAIAAVRSARYEDERHRLQVLADSPLLMGEDDDVAAVERATRLAGLGAAGGAADDAASRIHALTQRVRILAADVRAATPDDAATVAASSALEWAMRPLGLDLGEGAVMKAIATGSAAAAFAEALIEREPESGPFDEDTDPVTRREVERVSVGEARQRVASTLDVSESMAAAAAVDESVFGPARDRIAHQTRNR